jgi:hypothetical protein
MSDLSEEEAAEDVEITLEAAAQDPALMQRYLWQQRVKRIRQKAEQERQRWLQHWGPPWHYEGRRPCDDCDEMYDATGTRIPRCPTCREARRLEIMRECQKRRRRYRVALDAAIQKQFEAALAVEVGAEKAKEMTDPRPRCQHCQRRFQPRRRDARFCTTKCRVAAYRARKAAP